MHRKSAEFAAAAAKSDSAPGATFLEAKALPDRAANRRMIS
jgi:hypothetical protein